MRHDGRMSDALRSVSIQPGFTEMAAGSVLICSGRTRVLCTAAVPARQGQGLGYGGVRHAARRNAAEKGARIYEARRPLG